MSRIFTTPFVFQGKEYASLVSVRKTERKPIYTIRIFDEELKEIIGSEVIECEGYDGYLQKTSLNSEATRNLISCIMSAIRKYMEKSSQTPAG